MNEEERTPSVKIGIIARILRKRFDFRARSIGLTSAQWRTIAVVHSTPGITQRGIASRLEVGDVTIGRLIDRLCEEGWIERRPDPNDRRAYRIYLAPSAGPLLGRLAALGADEERITFAGISAEERARFEAVLDRIWQNLQTVAVEVEEFAA